jgi:SAM-dependent methyltransferase
MATIPYTHGHHDSVLRSHRWRTADNSAGYLLPHLRPGMSLLDVGCGPGTITADLATRLAPGRVVGLDASAEVIHEARKGAADGPAGLSYEVGDLFQLDYDDGAFDVVHAHQVLQHVGDPVAALVEMKRVCRSGGLVAARDGDYPAMVFYPSYPELERSLVPTGPPPGPTAPSAMPAGSSSRGQTGPGSPRWSRPPPPGVSPPRRNGPGGVTSGPTG